MCTGLHMEVEDRRGKTWTLNATADVGAPWSPYPSAITFNSLMRWTLRRPRWLRRRLPNYNLPYLNQRRGRLPPTRSLRSGSEPDQHGDETRSRPGCGHVPRRCTARAGGATRP
jgi:hypothetical protein